MYVIWISHHYLSLNIKYKFGLLVFLCRCCETVAAQQRVWQRRSGARSLLDLPARPRRRGHPRTSPFGCIGYRCFSGSVWCGVPSCLLQTQARRSLLLWWFDVVLHHVNIIFIFLSCSCSLYFPYIFIFAAFVAELFFINILCFNWWVWFRLQMLDHFAECIKQAKGVRQQAVQLNIFTAVLSALKVRKKALYPLKWEGNLGNSYSEK